MLNEREKQIIRELQEDLPLVNRPFEKIAQKLGMEEQELINKIKELKEQGIMRRFGAAVKHQHLGYIANAMVVWKIPENEIVTAGDLMSEYPEISHCYQRPTYPGWPYNLFTVLHGKTEEECINKAKRISKETGYYNYRCLFSTKELKKSSMKYFVD
ncbi:MAG: Lrp/AsnC family transcriptional regulator [Clostridiales bacterium]|nr:Lrp/AsnC family transcriptional regulator [Clostridiales bacterium]MCF8021933.1 Lrp/AsnC family transcriptional regulator [Clostridiales bacterium]